MKLKEIHTLAVELGKENDPRSADAVKRTLRLAQEEFDALSDEKKVDFDQERLTNPYSDARILAGDPDREIRGLIAGVDMEVGEVMLADRLREKGEPIDLVMSHHPEGKALTGLAEVMKLQEDILHMWGVPIAAAEGIMGKRIKEVERGIWPVNHNQAVDAANLLDLAYMSTHTPADNMVTTFLTNHLESKTLDTMGEVVEAIREIPEYAQAAKIGAGPNILLGSDRARVGKLVVEMTGGTSGSEDAYERLSAAGVSTMVQMHMGDKHRKMAEKYNINVIIAGHIASDAVGMNLILDQIEANGVKVYTCSGITRVKR
ncbi:MAG: NGG1p interacting factor NIF3 [Coriobacteriia bacterium]|nr:NGG1p interacting factor NIF3 [Coriobacteriia bacterium]